MLIIGVLGFVVLLLCRAFYLQIYRYDFYKTKSAQQLNRIFTLFPNRGIIYDRNLEPIALTKMTYSAYAIPSQIENKRAFAKEVTHHLGGSWSQLEARITTNSPFVWIKRKLDMHDYHALTQLNLKGLDFVKERKREYPKGELASQVMGFVGIDNQGLAGLEYYHDSFLKGSPGKLILEGDPRGVRLVSGKKVTYPPDDGGNIITTLDEQIQYSAQKHLAKSVQFNEAISGQVIVMNPKTGEVLAMACYPSFDPNTLPTSNLNTRRNSIVTDFFEPGSVFKIITLAAVLEEDIYEPDSIIKVPESIMVNGHRVKEAHERDEEESDEKTLTEILSHSLNVGTTILAKELGEERFYKYIRSFGFGKRTDIELPAESPGLLRAPKYWSGVDISMFSFGQGVAVTPLQMATAAAVIANGGELIKPRIIKSLDYHDGRSFRTNPRVSYGKVISKKTSQEITDMLVETVNHGTGQTVKIPGYDIAGKTGTAQKAKKDGRGYEKGEYMASFIGYFPAYNPEYLIFVVVESPKKSIYGSTVAGPVFKHIAEDIIRYRSIPPKVTNL